MSTEIQCLSKYNRFNCITWPKLMSTAKYKIRATEANLSKSSDIMLRYFQTLAKFIETTVIHKSKAANFNSVNFSWNILLSMKG